MGVHSEVADDVGRSHAPAADVLDERQGLFVGVEVLGETAVGDAVALRERVVGEAHEKVTLFERAVEPVPAFLTQLEVVSEIKRDAPLQGFPQGLRQIEFVGGRQKKSRAFSGFVPSELRAHQRGLGRQGGGRNQQRSRRRGGENESANDFSLGNQHLTSFESARKRTRRESPDAFRPPSRALPGETRASYPRFSLRVARARHLRFP